MDHRICRLLRYMAVSGLSVLGLWANHVWAQDSSHEQPLVGLVRGLGSADRSTSIVTRDFLANGEVLAFEARTNCSTEPLYDRTCATSVQSAEQAGLCDLIWWTVRFPGARSFTSSSSLGTRRFLLPARGTASFVEYAYSTSGRILSIDATWRTSGGWNALAAINLVRNAFPEVRVGSITARSWVKASSNVDALYRWNDTAIFVANDWLGVFGLDSMHLGVCRFTEGPYQSLSVPVFYWSTMWGKGYLVIHRAIASTERANLLGCSRSFCCHQVHVWSAVLTVCPSIQPPDSDSVGIAAGWCQQSSSDWRVRMEAAPAFRR
jgi:hypothetical protein